ncbi:magnesium transporter CorA family protein, partial [uncultured Methanoculleus sp.]
FNLGVSLPAMIFPFRTVDGALTLRDHPEEGGWVHVLAPSDEEKEYLIQEHGIPRDCIEEALDPDALARARKLDGSLSIVLLCSRSGAEQSVPFVTQPLGIVLREKMIVTICSRDPELIFDLLLEDAYAVPTYERHRFCLMILLQNARIFKVHLGEIRERGVLDEEVLTRALTGTGLIDLLDGERSLAYFVSALGSNQEMVEALRSSRYLEPEDRDLLEDVVHRNRESLTVANTTAKLHNDLIGGFTSLVSLNLNNLVRTLTEITIALSVPAIIGALWGMEVSLPLKEHSLAFWVILSLMGVLAVATFVIIRAGELLDPARHRR